jgi:hypothetical protein
LRESHRKERLLPLTGYAETRNLPAPTDEFKWGEAKGQIIKPFTTDSVDAEVGDRQLWEAARVDSLLRKQEATAKRRSRGPYGLVHVPACD